MDLGELRQMLTDWASRIVRFTQIASAKSDGSANVAGRSYAGGPAAPNIKARLIFPFGLRSVPPSGVDAAVIHAAGASARGMIVACDSTQYGPSDLADGESALYSIGNAKAIWVNRDGEIVFAVGGGSGKLDKDGTWSLTSSGSAAATLDKDGKATVASSGGATATLNADGSADVSPASGKDLTFNSGTHKVARVSAGDKTESHNHTITIDISAVMYTVDGVPTLVSGMATGTISTNIGLEITSGGAENVMA